MTTQSHTPAPLRVWLVLSDKGGDNGQVESIAAALPWSCETKRMRVLPPYVLGKPRTGPTLYHVDLERSDQLEPPWPDLILTAGRRCENVALWIREKSGGHSRVVVIGKPAAKTDSFSLVVHSAEQLVPPLPATLAIGLPLMRVDGAAVTAAAGQWRGRLADLPRPLVAILVGGPTATYVYNGTAVKRIAREARRIAEREGGTPYLVTSRRTPSAVADALEQQLPSAARVFRWREGSNGNPYLALLGIADTFVVTADSISMMVEIARLARPLAILPMPTGWLGAMDQMRRSLTRILYAPAPPGSLAGRLRQRLALQLFRLGVLGYTRDLNAFHRNLVDDGIAVWAGHRFKTPGGDVADELPRVVARIESLMEKRD